MKLGIQLRLPLLGQVGRAQDGHARRLAPVEEFPGDQPRFDRLSHADVIGDQKTHRVQLQSHQEGNQLIGSGLHADSGKGAERSGAGTEAQTDGVPQETAGAVIADLIRVGKVKTGRFYRLQGGADPGNFILCPPQRPQHQKIVLRLGEHHPFSAARSD